MPWEFVGPKDSSSISAMYNWGNGHLIAGTDFIPGIGKPKKAVYISRNHGKDWDTLSVGGGLEYYKVESFSYIKNRLYACLNGNTSFHRDTLNFETFFFSEDSGATWYCARMFPGSSSYWALGNDSVILVGNSYHVSKSTDGGKNWTTHNVGSGVCYSVAKYNDTIYAGCYKGLWVSIDWGKTWAFRSTSTSIFFSLEFLGSLLIMGSQSGVFAHYHFGNQQISDWQIGILKGPTTTRACPIADSIVFASVLLHSNAKSYLYYSSDSAKTFHQFWIESDTISPPQVYRFFSDGTYVFALTKKGIYRKAIYNGTVLNKKNKINNNLDRLRINNNGIFSSQDLKIKYDDISIFSIKGRKINLVFSSYSTTSLLFNQFNLPAGLYLIKIHIGNKFHNQKIIVMK